MRKRRHGFAGSRCGPTISISLSPGYYPVLIRCAIHAAPSSSSNPVHAVVSFRDILDPGDADKQWLAGLKEKKGQLEEIVRELPNSAEARTASSMLELLAR